MLVLTRKIGEEITIGENIVIKVVSIRGRAAVLGISGPTSVPILRSELAQRIAESAGRNLETCGKHA